MHCNLSFWFLVAPRPIVGGPRGTRLSDLPKSMPTKRANRYIRPKPITMILTSRDENIITRCFEDKLLSSSDLQCLFFGTKQRCNRRLRKLYSQHYLDRHFIATPLPFCGAKDALYSPGKRGVDVVALQKDIPKEQIHSARQKFARQLKSYSVLFTLAHIQAVAKARLAVEKAFFYCYEAELINWIPERLLEQRFSNDDKQMKLRPDGFMQYEIKDSGKTYNAFIETDMDSQSSKQIQEKVRRYLAFSQTSLPQERFGSPWFRVLFISKTQRRSQNIKAAIEAITDKIFWMTDFDQIQGDWLLEPIFLRVGRDGLFPLLGK